MLVVIFGAGASYDSLAVPPNDINWLQYRAPLANELFGWRFRRELALFHECKPVIAPLQKSGAEVERELEKLQNQSKTDPERLRQLAGIRYYLQVMITNLQSMWTNTVTSGITNYGTLLDLIRHYKDPRDRVCLVTFNYDTLLEEALPNLGKSLSSMNDYITGDYLLFKPHGSINWAHEVRNNVRNLDTRGQDDVARELIRRAPELQFSQSYYLMQGGPIGRSNNPPRVPLFPAIAIPVETKSEYEFPQDHLKTLEELLPQATKLLIIGWRGAEDRFVSLLAERLGRDPRIMVVSRENQRAKEVANRLGSAGVSGNFNAVGGGFSWLTLSGAADAFLSA